MYGFGFDVDASQMLLPVCCVDESTLLLREGPSQVAWRTVLAYSGRQAWSERLRSQDRAHGHERSLAGGSSSAADVESTCLGTWSSLPGLPAYR
jgi:hypothetical protein